MSNNSLNFRTPLYTILALVFLVLTACQKEQLEINPSLDTPIAKTETTTEIHEIDLTDLDTKLRSNARADSWNIMNKVVEITNTEHWGVGLAIDALPNPNTHRIDVTVIPLDRPTDLYLSSHNPTRNPTILNLKDSQNPDMQSDFIKFRENDFIHGEDLAILTVRWQGIGNKFEIKINAVPVDCEEDDPRRQGDVGIEYQPVCGCDDRTYFDAAAAYNAGITSYERGQCLPNPIIPIEGIWEAINPDRGNEVIEFFKDCFFLTVQDINYDGTTSEHTYIVCPEEEEAEKEESGFTFTVTDKDVEKGFPLIWPVEKWSAQVNGQGELEIVRTNGAVDKDKEEKKEHATILNRYKRIK